MRFRQVHLDFHTSGLIPGIGAEFNKKQFQNALKEGHVDSITVFAKCHHGFSYHPTKVNQMHPNLSFDLLGAQMEACREINVKTPVYISAGFDEKEAVRHPEWLVRQPDESLSEAVSFFEPGYHHLCYNTPYLELLLAQIGEVMELYRPEGIFLDISAVRPCYCARCRQDILERGKDYRDPEAVMEQAEIVYRNYTKRVEDVVRRYSKECTIFHNGGHVVRGRRDLAHANTHLELESLPTGGWGYDHFPMSASYAMNLGMEYLGMTGKFHTSWGEFGGYKHPNALRYEAALSLAFGAKCSIGDQLHPSGYMDEETYRIIGEAYAEVEEKEPWCKGAVNCADVAVLSEEAVNFRNSDCQTQRYGDIGANRIMLEGKYLYRLIDLECRFEDYKVLILPDTIRVDEKLKKRLEAYLSRGGKILATGSGGLDQDEDAFALPFGAKFLGEGEFRPDYMVYAAPSGKLAAHVVYEQRYRIETLSGEVFAWRQPPYFNRDVLHFSSHRHAPNVKGGMEEAAVATENTAYIGWNVFTDYGKIGALHDKQIIREALDGLLAGGRSLETNLPDKAVATLTKQGGEGRYIAHLLYAHTTIRGAYESQGKHVTVECIEDIVPLYGVEVKVRVAEKIRKVYLAPQRKELPFEYEGNAVCFTVEKVLCHQMVVLEY